MVGLGRCHGIDLFEEEREQYLMILGSSRNWSFDFSCVSFNSTCGQFFRKG